MRTAKVRQSFLEAKQDFSPRTLEQYSTALGYLERECPEMPKGPEPLRRALNKLATPWTRDAAWRAWSSFFHWYSKQKRILNVMEWVDRPKRPEVEMRSLDPGELASVLAAADNLRDRALLSLALDSGIRASEFGRLRIHDVGTDSLWVLGKGNKRARVPISPETHRFLELLAKNDGCNGLQSVLFPDSLLFPNQNGQPMSRYAIYRIVRHCMERAGISGPKRGPHCLRHSLGKNYIEDGGDPFTLKRIMRHRNIATTQKYVNLSMQHVIEQHHRHSPLREALRGTQSTLWEQEVEEILEGRPV